jgi:hypothetical protein
VCIGRCETKQDDFRPPQSGMYYTWVPTVAGDEGDLSGNRERCRCGSAREGMNLIAHQVSVERAIGQ